jgi:hypothetical protein
MGFQTVEQAILVTQASMKAGQTATQIALFKPDGTPFTAAGQAAAQVDAVAMTSAAATGGDAPTEAEYNALRTDVVNLRNTVNSLLGKLRTGGVIAP